MITYDLRAEHEVVAAALQLVCTAGDLASIVRGTRPILPRTLPASRACGLGADGVGADRWQRPIRPAAPAHRRHRTALAARWSAASARSAHRSGDRVDAGGGRGSRRPGPPRVRPTERNLAPWLFRPPGGGRPYC